MSSFLPLLSGLNSLSPDASPVINQQELEAELGFWGNVQFTFDVPPGMGIYDDDQNEFERQGDEGAMKGNASSNEHSIQLEALSQYLDYDLNEKQEPSTLRPQLLPSLNAGNATINHLPQINTMPAFLLAPAITLPPSSLDSRIASTQSPTTSSITPTILSNPILSSPTVSTFAAAKPILIQPSFSSSTPLASVGASNLSKAGSKRHHVSVESTEEPTDGALKAEEDHDITAKIAAEEDKRRRNTAASARFRIKKKQREQALERTARENAQKVEMLETRIRELEKENKWLRGLIVEKDSRLLDIPEGKKASVEEPEGEAVDAKARA